MWLGVFIFFLGSACVLVSLDLFRNDFTFKLVAACLGLGGVICYAVGSLMEEERHVPPVNRRKFVPSR